MVRTVSSSYSRFLFSYLNVSKVRTKHTDSMLFAFQLQKRTIWGPKWKTLCSWTLPSDSSSWQWEIKFFSTHWKCQTSHWDGFSKLVSGSKLLILLKNIYLFPDYKENQKVSGSTATSMAWLLLEHNSHEDLCWNCEHQAQQGALSSLPS